MVLKSREVAPDWSAGEDPLEEAKCRKHPLPKNHDVSQDPWFYSFDSMTEAQRICNGDDDGTVCPFRAQCLYMALINNEQSGVFGGLHPIQRRWIRRQIPKDAWKLGDMWFGAVPSLEWFSEEERKRQEEMDAA